MIEVDITPEISRIAETKAAEMGSLKNSITDGEGNYAGFLAEEAVKSYLGLPLGTRENTFDYDFIYCGLKMEVKCKRTTVVPKPDYEASVAAYNTRQKCDYYVLTRAFLPHKIFIMGYLTKEEYYKKARFLKEGTRDGNNGFIVKKDCYNIFYQDTLPLSNLIEEAKTFALFS